MTKFILILSLVLLMSGTALAKEVVNKYCELQNDKVVEVVKLAMPSQKFKYEHRIDGQWKVEQGTFLVKESDRTIRFQGTSLAALGTAISNEDSSAIKFTFKNEYTHRPVTVEYAKQNCTTFP